MRHRPGGFAGTDRHREYVRRFRGVLIAFAALLAVTFAIGWGLGQTRTAPEEPVTDLDGRLEERLEQPRTVRYQDNTYQYREGLTTILFMTIGRAETEDVAPAGLRGDERADLLLVLVLDAAAHTITPIHIDRDTVAQLEVPDASATLSAPIHFAPGYGADGADGRERTRAAVQALLGGVDIDLYAALDANALPALNDALGGVEVTLADDFSALDPAMVAGRTLRLAGEQAAHYVGALAGESGEARALRQRHFLQGMLAALGGELSRDAGALRDLYGGLGSALTSSAKLGRLINEVYAARGYTLEALCTPEGERAVDGDGLAAFYTDEASLQALVIDAFYRRA